jgi:hypothetical protein
MSQIGSESQTPASGDFGIPAEPPAWPKVVGIISIVLASLGIPCSACISVGALGGSAMYEWGRQQQIKAGHPDPGSMPAPFQPTVVDIGSAALWLLGVVVLLVAGIMTVRRKSSGRPAHVVYGVISILGTLVYLSSSMMKAQAIANWIAQNPGHPFLKQPGIGMSSSPIGAVLMSALCLIYPIFILIWFGPMGKRPEAGAGDQEPLV